MVSPLWRWPCPLGTQSELPGRVPRLSVAHLSLQKPECFPLIQKPNQEENNPSLRGGHKGTKTVFQETGEGPAGHHSGDRWGLVWPPSQQMLSGRGQCLFIPLPSPGRVGEARGKLPEGCPVTDTIQKTKQELAAPQGGSFFGGVGLVSDKAWGALCYRGSNLGLCRQNVGSAPDFYLDHKIQKCRRLY